MKIPEEISKINIDYIFQLICFGGYNTYNLLYL